MKAAAQTDRRVMLHAPSKPPKTSWWADTSREQWRTAYERELRRIRTSHEGRVPDSALRFSTYY